MLPPDYDINKFMLKTNNKKKGSIVVTAIR